MKREMLMLEGQDFHGEQLDNLNFAMADLHGADFSNASICSTSFLDARLEGANFAGAILVDTNLAEAHIERANFDHAILLWTEMSDTKIDDTNFHHAIAIGVHGIDQAYLRAHGAFTSMQELLAADEQGIINHVLVEKVIAMMNANEENHQMNYQGQFDI